MCSSFSKQELEEAQRLLQRELTPTQLQLQVFKKLLDAILSVCPERPDEEWRWRPVSGWTGYLVCTHCGLKTSAVFYCGSIEDPKTPHLCANCYRSTHA